MKLWIALLVVLVLLILVPIGLKLSDESEPSTQKLNNLYISWDTMEFDKCVAVWLITKYIDPNAQFMLVPQNTEITEGVPFDIPGAEWSRKHRRCTSQCLWDSIDINDSAAERIIDMAGKIELNFWQLDRWPDAYKHFHNIRQIMDATPNGIECFEKTKRYFDKLYEEP